ncbi:unnamed protein product [Prorocentrum cordatum]|uniref:PH domain-containing protein n=1 Tax=Prorocentrum cordatum TaxID=2364126 RepID=A0ABN9U8Z3_9DINO|nr:unnamed protein product [Polarella glacialis]
MVATAAAAVADTEASKAWQEELAAELAKAGGRTFSKRPALMHLAERQSGRAFRRSASSISSVPSRSTLSKSWTGASFDCTDLEVEEKDKKRWTQLKASIGKELHAPIPSAVGPSAGSIQRLRQEGREMPAPLGEACSPGRE